MPQLSLLPDSPLKPDPQLGEPVIWIQQLKILESLDTPAPIQDIPFRRGLNIIATEEALPTDGLPVGHDVGKTMLVRIIRYCLGEEHYCDQETRGAVTEVLPNSYVLARFRVAGEDWCVARPLGLLSGASSSWSLNTVDIESLRKSEGKRRYPDFLEALNKATSGCYADVGLPRAEDRRARWQDLLGWLSRDQECLFRHHAEWRVSESQAGPRVLTKEDSYLVMRMALGLLDGEEISAAQRYETLRKTLAEQQTRATKLMAFMERTASYLKDAFKSKGCEAGSLTEVNLFSPALREFSQEKIESLSGLLQDIWARQEIREAQSLLDVEVDELAKIENRVNDLEAQKEQREKNLAEVKQQDGESFIAKLGQDGFPCNYWPGNKEAAKTAGCPGKDVNAEGFDSNELRRKASVHAIEQDLIVMTQALTTLQKTREQRQLSVETLRTTLRNQIAQQFRDQRSVGELIGGWRGLLAQLQDFQEASRELDTLSQALEVKELDLRAAKDLVSNARGAIAIDLAKLSSCYQDVVRCILTKQVAGTIVVDGSGIRPRVTGASSSGTTLKRCTRVLGFDLACLKASICGIGHLPRFWIHDSPRAADTEDVLYHRLMEIVWGFERAFESSEPTFQHIWTTTSKPPEALNREPYIRLRLHARSDSGKLLKRSLAMLPSQEVELIDDEEDVEPKG